MTIQIGSGDLYPVADLAKIRAILQPGPVLIQQRLNFFDHVKMPRRIMGGTMMLQYRMKSWSVCHASCGFGK